MSSTLIDFHFIIAKTAKESFLSSFFTQKAISQISSDTVDMKNFNSKIIFTVN